MASRGERHTSAKYRRATANTWCWRHRSLAIFGEGFWLDVGSLRLCTILPAPSKEVPIHAAQPATIVAVRQAAVDGFHCDSSVMSRRRDGTRGPAVVAGAYRAAVTRCALPVQARGDLLNPHRAFASRSSMMTASRLAVGRVSNLSGSCFSRWSASPVCSSSHPAKRAAVR